MQLDDVLITTREVTDWQGFHLFHFDLSSCSQKMRIVFRELGLSFVPHPINLIRDEQRTDWYLGSNPRGEVPVLVHDGVVHTQSNDIIQYIGKNFAPPERFFLPATPAEHADAQDLLDLGDDLHQDLRTMTFTYLAPDTKNRASDSKESLDFIGRFHTAFQKLDHLLISRAYLLGDQLTLLDISWFITLYRLDLAGYPLSEHRRLSSYFGRIKARRTFMEEINAGPPQLRLGAAVYHGLNCIFRRSLARDYARWQRSAGTTS